MEGVLEEIKRIIEEMSEEITEEKNKKFVKLKHNESSQKSYDDLINHLDGKEKENVVSTFQTQVKFKERVRTSKIRFSETSPLKKGCLISILVVLGIITLIIIGFIRGNITIT